MTQDLAMQFRCVYCKREQFIMNVFSLSKGEIPCCWCGLISNPMTDQEYKEALEKEIKK